MLDKNNDGKIEKGELPKDGRDDRQWDGEGNEGGVQ